MEQESIMEENNKNVQADAIFKKIKAGISDQVGDTQDWIKGTPSMSVFAIKFFTKKIAGIKYMKSRKIYYLEIPNDFSKIFEKEPDMKSVSNGIRYSLKDDNAISDLIDPLVNVYNYLQAEYMDGEMFGCCHKYIECSEVKHCIHPDKVYSNKCHYKNNLENGRIFYGSNKNI
ncbi:MAG: hypothetical protein ACOYB8_00405 [Eubacteriaceae bacterium]|jgi:hypothetical protein